MTWNVTIKPAIEPELRHKIEDFLKREGYLIAGGGTDADMSQSDFTFYTLTAVKKGLAKNKDY